MNSKPEFAQILLLAQRLIAVPSATNNNQACNQALSIITSELKGFAYRSFISKKHRSLLFYNRPQQPVSFSLILNGHIDVVPGSKDQFRPHISDNRLYGRGSYDMKTAVAVMIVLFKRYAHSLPYSLGLQIVSDEETGGFHGTKEQIDKGVYADFVLAGEPSNFDLITKAKGFLRYIVSAQGLSAHGAYPWDGTNALWKLITGLTALQERYPTPSKAAWVSTINLADIETTNDVFNTVPGNAQAKLDVRYIPSQREQIMQDILATTQSYDLHCELVAEQAARNTAKSNPHVQTLSSLATTCSGRQSKTTYTHGGSDLSYYAAVGCPGVEFGPVGDGLHNSHEWVDLDSVEQYYQVLKQFVLTYK